MDVDGVTIILMMINWLYCKIFIKYKHHHDDTIRVTIKLKITLYNELKTLLQEIIS
jgi:hypothetical protein